MKHGASLLALPACMAGILTACLTGLVPWMWLLLLLAVAGATLICFLLNRPGSGLLILGFFFALTGFFMAASRSGYWEEYQFNQRFNDREISLAGTIAGRPERTEWGGRFLFQADPRSGLPGGLLRVYTPEPLPAQWYGWRVTVTGRFQSSHRPEGIWPEMQELRCVNGSLSCRDLPRRQDHYGLPFYYGWADTLRRALIQQGENALRPEQSSLLHGMLFGDRLGEEADQAVLMENFRRTGTIHLLSVSGLHIGLAALALNFLLAVVKVPRRWRIGPMMAGILLYCLMTGLSPPVLRSGLMIFILMLGELLEAKDEPLNRLALAGVLLLLFNPYYLFEIGFQLSFLATLGVIWLYPFLREVFPIKIPFIKLLWQGILLSVAVQIIILPPLIQYFQQISWSAPLANLVLMAPAEVIVIGGLAGEASGILLPWLGGLILVPVGWALDFTRWSVQVIGSQPWAAVWSPLWTWPWLIGYYVGVLLCLDWIRPNRLQKHDRRRWIWLGGILCLAIAISAGLHQLQRLPTDYLQVTFIDVGQGDAIFLKSPDGKTLLVDGGSNGQGTWRVCPYLRSAGVDALDWMVITHNHSDHLGGLDEVLAKLSARNLLAPVERGGPGLADLLRQCTGNCRCIQRASQDHFQLGREVQVEVLHAPGAGNENDRSTILLVSYGKNRLLLTGDLGDEGEAILEERFPQALPAILLKVGHHGSDSGTGASFLARVRPRIAVISVGADNDFGHPSQATLLRLRAAGATVYRTDRHGQISVRVYRDRLIVKTAKGGL
jgi:competence protein ComEC